MRPKTITFTRDALCIYILSGAGMDFGSAVFSKSKHRGGEVYV